MKSGRSGALKPDKLGLNCKDNKCSDAGTWDLGMLPNHSRVNAAISSSIMNEE